MDDTVQRYPLKEAQIRGQSMAYIDVGEGDPIVFLHGNPTSSYLWRDVIPHLADLGRCIAPDLIGMGHSAKLPEAGPDSYRFPYRDAAARLPTLAWPREIPIDGQPADVVEIVQHYADWLSHSEVRKLFINADPGSILTGAPREFCRKFPNQTEVTVKGIHFIQEDSPNEIGIAIRKWIQAAR